MSPSTFRTSSLACAFAAIALVSGLTANIPVHSADTAPPQNLSAYRDKNRVLLVFATSAEDSRYRKQNELFSGKEGGLTERDLVRINVLAKPSSALRKRYGVGGRRLSRSSCR